MGTGTRALAIALLGVAALSAPARAACNLEKAAEIPVEIAGLRALVPAKIDGHDAKLAVDTGAFFSTLGPASAAKFGLRLSTLPPGMTVRGEMQAHYGVAKDFRLSDLPSRSTPARRGRL